MTARAPAHFDKVLRHAERKLAGHRNAKPGDRLDLYRRFLKIEEHRLKLAHAAGENGRSFVHKRADLITILLRHIWQSALDEIEGDDARAPARISLLAVGGFGRRELNPFSDVDILFLHDSATPAAQSGVEKIVSKVLYLLWDIGFQVGHSTRNMEELVIAASEDLRTLTALLDVRWICGDEKPFQRFTRDFATRCLKGGERQFIEWRARDQATRHRKYSNTVFLQEPNVKNGCGGLRDYHNLMWVARVARGFENIADLQEAGLINASERKSIETAYDFILRMRSELHYVQKRYGDILTLHLQGHIATHFKYPGRTVLRRTETLMRDYYNHTNDLFLLTNSLAQRLSESQKNKSKKKSGAASPPASGREIYDVFAIQDHKIEAVKLGIFKDDPLRLLRVFQLAQQHDADLGPELRFRVRRRNNLVTRSFIYQKAVREMLLSIFSSKGSVGRICRRMHELGLLGRLFPEFAPLTCLVQHEFFHRYTADEHTLVCLEMLDRIIDAQEPPFSKYRDLFKRVTRPHLLYLAVLLHDTGKEANRRHHADISAENAQRVARRLRLGLAELSILVFLVDQHLILSDTARRKNLEDAEAILEFARIVETQERLDLLMLLTFADFQGTDVQQTSSDWKELVFWQLYRRTSEALAGGKEFALAARKSLGQIEEHLTEKLSDAIELAEIAAHFQNLPQRYFNMLPEEAIEIHIRCVHEFLVHQLSREDEALRPIIHWRDHPDQGHSEVIIVTWDRQRLFSRITGAFARCGLSILSAEVFTRQDNIVVDSYRVATARLEAVTEPRDKREFEKIFIEALQSTSPGIAEIPPPKSRPGFEDADFPTRISFDQQASRNYTLFDLQTPDFPGLLYSVATCLADAGIGISHARISTEKGAALDTFYLYDGEGKKITSEETLKNFTAQLKKKLAL
jgi:[protein-PII] uridylyltransferase